MNGALSTTEIFLLVTATASIAVAVGMLILVIHTIGLMNEVRAILRQTKADLGSFGTQIHSLTKEYGKGVVVAGLVADGMMGLYNSLKKSKSVKTTTRKRS